MLVLSLCLIMTLTSVSSIEVRQRLVDATV